jgi:transcriptional regulator with XRE-family HTH domain
MTVDGLPEVVCSARVAMGLSQVALAQRAGISASYLSRIEGGSWLKGGPTPSDSVLRALARALDLSSSRLIELRDATRLPTQTRRTRNGRGPYAVLIGDEAVQQAAVDVVERSPQGGTLRITDVARLEHPRCPMHEGQVAHWDAIGRRLAEDSDALLYRVCSATEEHFDLVRAKTAHLAGRRDPASIGNIRTRFCFGNPLMFDVIVTEQEVLIGVPDRRGHPYLRAALVVDDPDFVQAMRAWYDEFAWEATCDCSDVRYPTAEQTLDSIEARLRPM